MAGWNFRKRVKILPGVTLNFSKNGITTSVGPKGARLSFGKNGTYLNRSIPGTGLYKRQRIGGNIQSSWIKCCFRSFVWLVLKITSIIIILFLGTFQYVIRLCLVKIKSSHKIKANNGDRHEDSPSI